MIDHVIGDSWPLHPLAEACDPKRSITYGIVQAGEHIDGGVPYIRVSDMTTGHLSIRGMLRTAPEIAARYERSKVRAGDIVFAIRATVGRMCFVPQELDGANLTQGTARITHGSNALIENIFWVLSGRAASDAAIACTKGFHIPRDHARSLAHGSQFAFHPLVSNIASSPNSTPFQAEDQCAESRPGRPPRRTGRTAARRARPRLCRRAIGAAAGVPCRQGFAAADIVATRDQPP